MTLTDEQVVTTRNDVEMLKRPHLWPQRRYICLKAGHERRGHGDDYRQFAHLFPNPDGSFVVRTFLGFSYTYDETLRYADAEAVVDDGWVVD